MPDTDMVPTGEQILSGTGEQAARHPASVDPADLARFERLGAEWWDDQGSMAALHRLNPVRIAFMRDAMVKQFGRTAGGDRPEAERPLSGLTVLDVGCGGGLLSEPLARLGAVVTGIDPGETNIGVARTHAADLGLGIDYRQATVDTIAARGERFDVVIASEVIEHVVDQPAFAATACGLVRPGGLLLASTLNRTAKSFALAIVGAEYILRWLPRGTHHWRQFVRPSELSGWAQRAGLQPIGTRGMIFDPLANRWRLGRDTDVNYLFAARRPAA